MPQITITAAGYRFVAVTHPDAPLTVAAFMGLLPYRQAELVSRIEPWGFFIVLALVITGIVSTIWLVPLMSLSYYVLNILLSPLAMIFG